jgi:hypothetical protein
VPRGLQIGVFVGKRSGPDLVDLFLKLERTFEVTQLVLGPSEVLSC